MTDDDESSNGMAWDSDMEWVDLTDDDAEIDISQTSKRSKAKSPDSIGIAGPSYRESQDKRPRDDDTDIVQDFSDIDEDLAIRTTTTKDGKRTRLSESDLVKRKNAIVDKTNKKINEMRAVDKIYDEVHKNAHEKSQAKRGQIVFISSDDESDDEVTRPNPPPKRSIDEILHPDKFRRVPPTSIEKKMAGLYSRSEKMKIMAGKKLPRRRSSTNTPTLSIGLPTINNPYLTRQEMTKRQNAILYEEHVPEKRDVKKKSKKKVGGCVETEFIPYNENIAYEFYDDPNELCERLRLLIASRSAGNSNHSQEINSIISELRELGVIK